MMQQGLGMAGQAAKAAKDAGLSAPELMAMQQQQQGGGGGDVATRSVQ
jgi:hypothetical protein